MELVEITDTAYNGYGVGRTSAGKAVFIPYSVTGDVVEAEITADKPSHCTAKITRLVKSSDWRTEPECEYYENCGGCNFAHIQYDKQLEIKKRITLNALRKHPQMNHITENFSMVSDKPFNYRIRATFRVLDGQLGFLRPASHDFVPVRRCLCVSETLFDKCKTWATNNKKNVMFEIAALENTNGDVIAAVHNYPAGRTSSLAPLSGIKYNKDILGSFSIIYQTAGGDVPVACGGFFQANRYLIDKLQAYATTDIIGNVLELYAGSGFFTAAMLKNGANISAIELDKTAASLGRQLGYPIKHGDAASISETNYDTILVDPSREGLSTQTIKKLLQIKAEKFVYISCNPMTLARDLEKFSMNYNIDEITLFDNYPHTYHIENVAKLTAA
ncbi:23S rRNA (uracil(1939)-C(5))-methyltransferase RlmD [Deferribacterales bacterium RsTz2092]